MKSAKNLAEEGKAKAEVTTAEASAKRGQTEGEKKRNNDWLDTSCRTEATVGLIKLRELAEVSSGWVCFEVWEKEGETGTVLYSDTNKFSRNGIVFEVDTFAE